MGKCDRDSPLKQRNFIIKKKEEKRNEKQNKNVNFFLQGQDSPRSRDDDDPLYQSIPARSDTARSRDDEVDTPTFEKGQRFQNYSDLPRGVK